MKCYRKDYPRMQFVRDEWINLNGSWDFAFDDNNKGEINQWFHQFPEGIQIQVPFSYETKLSGLQDEKVHNHVWYRKNIEVEQAELMDKRLYLHFEGCDYITKVWLNGHYVGSHEGGYTRFSFDITDYIHAGSNTITVKAEDSLSRSQPRGKQRWLDHNFGCWYVQTTGIWKTVWMEYVPERSIDQVKMTPDINEKTLKLEFDVLAESYTEDLAVDIEVTYQDKLVNKISVPVDKKHVKTSICVYSSQASELHLWSPETPNLYDISFRLYEKERELDRVLSYFGMREIKVVGNQILLNHKPIYQRLILDQGYWEDSHLTPPSEEALKEDITKIRQLGYNGLRKHQKTEDERFLYWCDVEGMLVWGETPATYEYSDQAVEAFTRQWMNIVRQNYNHPSIIAWTPFNESWGVDDISNDKSQQQFTQGIYYLTKAYDSMRPVISNDGWEHTKSDIITIHDYKQDGDKFYAKYSQGKEAILSNDTGHAGIRLAFAEGFSYEGQPVIISEYGGIAMEGREEGWGYGTKVEGEEAFLERFDKLTTAIKKLPYVCGFCYTQVSDVQQEVNGLMDMKRNFKVDPKRIHEINTAEVVKE